MLKKRYNGIIVIIVSVIAFAAAMMVLSILENKYHFGTAKDIPIIIMMAFLVTIMAVRVTVLRKVDVVIQPSDYPPEGINSMQAGCIIDGFVDPRDVSSAFFYMAQQGYLDITEYELKQFSFKYLAYPEHEHKSIQMLFKAVFGTAKAGETVKLDDAAERLIHKLADIECAAYKSISSKRNKEIAAITGKVLGFKESMLNNRDSYAQSLLVQDPEYIYKVIPYAYAFAITSKLSSNFGTLSINTPGWYHPFGIEGDSILDERIYNSMLRNLPEQLNKVVYQKTNDTYPIIKNAPVN